MGIVNYGQFVVSAILLNLVPGSDTVYVLTRAIVGGRKKGVISALGISTGILVHTLLAALGLSVILRESALAFNIMKIAGAGYLVFLGIKAVVSKKPLFDSDPESLDESPLKVYRQGVLTIALLPQFVSQSAGSSPLSFLALGLTFFTTSTIWSVVLAFAASFANALLRKNERVQKGAGKATGIIYILLGLNVLRSKISA